MIEEYIASVSEPNQQVNPLFTFLGIQVTEIGKDHATLTMSAKPELMQGAGKLAGGILATLLDEAMAHAVLGGNAGEATTTVDMNVKYYRPVSKGDTLICTGRVAKRGKKVVFAEAVIHNQDLECAAATATFFTLKLD